MMQMDRRTALKTIGATAGLMFGSRCAADKPAARRRVAAIVTVYKKNSHADVLIGKILQGWRQEGGPGPKLDLVSLYTDQVPQSDMSRKLASQHGFRIAKSIDEALTLGGDELAVDGVLSVGEHGDYPYTPDTGQHMYPRRRFFDDIVASMQRCGRFVPIFNDKHLAYAWKDAKHIYDLARTHKIPLMAGSSLPVCWRYPAEEIPLGTEMSDAMAVGYGGNEAYGFHALETLQCVVERRKGGESGVQSVTAVTGPKIWEAERSGAWSRRLLDRALKTFDRSADDLEKRLNLEKAAFYLLQYRDGFRATVAMLPGVATQFAVACQTASRPEPYANWFRLEEQAPFGHFEYLLRAIEHMVQSGQPAYPVERTLLTTGVLDRAMHSLAQGGASLATPELNIQYEPVNWTFANQTTENFPTPQVPATQR